MKRSSTELGQGLAEYAFLLVLIVIVIIAVLQVLGISVVDLYNGFVTSLSEVFS
jgi:Flp pilus assembly pilin Flp